MQSYVPVRRGRQKALVFSFFLSIVLIPLFKQHLNTAILLQYELDLYLYLYLCVRIYRLNMDTIITV